MMFSLLINVSNLIIKQAEAALVVATGASADLVSRIFVTVMSLCIEVKARYIYLSGAILTILLRFGN